MIDQSYDDTTYVPTIEEPTVNFEPMAASAPIAESFDSTPSYETEAPFYSEPEDEVEDLSPQDSIEQMTLDNDFSSLDKSEELPEVPQASALFNAIINSDNKVEESEKASLELNSVSPSEDDFFSSHMSASETPTPVEEPMMFDNNDNDTSVFKDTRFSEPEPEELPHFEEEDSRPNFIERVIGISRARRKSTVTPEPQMEDKFAEEKTGTDDSFDLSGDDLDIPSFLRRR